MINKIKYGLLYYCLLQTAFANQIEQYQYQVPLTEIQNSVAKLTLPLSVLSQIKYQDYADIAVFNQQEQFLPHQIKIKNKQIKKHNSLTESLVFYPLQKNKKQRDAEETRIEFWQHQKQSEDSKKIRRYASQDERLQYIIELPSKTNYTLTELTLSWEKIAENKVFPLKIESSYDLESWRTLKKRVIVAELSINNQKLIKNKITLRHINGRYLQISELETYKTFKIKSATAYYQKTTQQSTPLTWRQVDTWLDPKENAFLFDTGGIMPIEKLSFEVPDQPLYYQGILYSRANAQQAWQYQRSFQQYHLKIDNQWIDSSPIKLPSNYDRYWKAVLEQPKPMISEQLPRIKIGHYQVELFFLAQGTAPYILAFGATKQFKHQQRQIPAILKNQKNNAETIYLKGDINKQIEVIPPQTIAWKKGLLWLLLLFGTGFMLWMAIKLYQEMANHS